MVKFSDDEVELLRIIADVENFTDIRLYIISKIKNVGPNGDELIYALCKLMEKKLVEEIFTRVSPNTSLIISESEITYKEHKELKSPPKFYPVSKEAYEKLTRSNKRIIYRIKDPKILEGTRKLM